MLEKKSRVGVGGSTEKRKNWIEETHHKIIKSLLFWGKKIRGGKKMGKLKIREGLLGCRTFRRSYQGGEPT